MSKPVVDDPRKLSALLSRVAELAQAHRVGAVIVGLAAEQGDQLFPEFVEFLRSALRVEDGTTNILAKSYAGLHASDVAGETVTRFVRTGSPAPAPRSRCPRPASASCPAPGAPASSGR